MADDNVLFSNSTKLFSELQQQGKMFEMMTYPGSKHAMFGQQVQTHLHKTITSFFDRTLAAAVGKQQAITKVGSPDLRWQGGAAAEQWGSSSLG